MSKLYYKATDKDMKCRGYQFELGKWSDPVEGDLVLCKNGYHFCEQPSGVWAYYDEEGTRVFKCEVRDAVMSDEPGADVKSVCRQIRLVEEVEIGGDYNTGDYNTGNRNTGDCNTGDCNTGGCNTGDYNTGYRNTGDRNTGDYNTGYRNTGDRNTGDCNTGDCNTGGCNTGDRNTGDYNTGDYNVGNYHSGVFGVGDAPFTSFGVECDRDSFPWGLAGKLHEAIHNQPEGFDVKPYLSIPGATEEKIREYHKVYLEARKDK